MKKFPNIYLVGNAGAGKSTVANELIKRYNYKHIRFAGTLYNLAYNYFDMDKKVKDRYLLQIMGTEVGREQVNTDIWVNRVIEDVKIVQLTAQKLGYADNKSFVLDDCRFMNEHKALATAGWLGFYIDVPEEVRITRLNERDGQCDVSKFKHASETGMEEFRSGLFNVNGTRSIDEICNSIANISGLLI